MNKIVISVLSVLLVAIIGLVSLFVSTSNTDFDQKAKQFSELGGDFTLTSQEGPVSLSDFEGKVVVMYFGFLTCPEVCPNSLTVIRTALKRLDTESH